MAETYVYLNLYNMPAVVSLVQKGSVQLPEDRFRLHHREINKDARDVKLFTLHRDSLGGNKEAMYVMRLQFYEHWGQGVPICAVPIFLNPLGVTSFIWTHAEMSGRWESIIEDRKPRTYEWWYTWHPTGKAHYRVSLQFNWAWFGLYDDLYVTLTRLDPGTGDADRLTAEETPLIEQAGALAGEGSAIELSGVG